MRKFNENGIFELSCPFKPLLPVVTSNETYAYSQSTPNNLDPTFATSVFVSNGRFTPDCQYITFQGPEVGSNYVSELTTIHEAIFLALQDYIYEIEYSITGEIFNPPKFYVIDPIILRAYQVYDIYGNPAIMRCNKGKIEIYGFSKYLVLWSPDNLDVTLKITAKEQMSPTPTKCSVYNPLVPGKHYINDNGCWVLVYENIYDPETSLVTRVVVPQFQKANQIIRKQYFANYRIGCVLRNPLQVSQLPPVTNLVIEGDATITDFSAKYGLLILTPVVANSEIFCNILYYWLQLDNPGQTRISPIVTTDTTGANDSIMASYMYVNTSGFVKMVISFDMDFSQPGDFDCGRSFITQAPIFALINYHTGNDVETYDENLKPNNRRSILYADTSNNQKLKWRGQFIMKFTAGQYYWFKTTSVTKDYVLVSNAVASAITGSFEISYLT